MCQFTQKLVFTKHILYVPKFSRFCQTCKTGHDPSQKPERLARLQENFLIKTKKQLSYAGQFALGLSKELRWKCGRESS